MFIARVLVGPTKQLRQIIQIEHNIVKNLNWSEANQSAIYKRGRGFELWATEKQIQLEVRAGLEPGTAGMRVQQADHSVRLPPHRLV